MEYFGDNNSSAPTCFIDDKLRVGKAVWLYEAWIIWAGITTCTRTSPRRVAHRRDQLPGLCIYTPSQPSLDEAQLTLDKSYSIDCALMNAR